MDGFKDSTKMKYMMGGDVKAYKTGGTVKMSQGGTYNERGKRATLAEMEAEDRRMGSIMPAKKPVGPSSVAVSKVLSAMTKPAVRRSKGGLTAMPKGKC